MKVLFFVALLTNIVFFMWEFRSGGLNSPLEIVESGSHQTKEILLVSELPSQNDRNSVTITANNMGLDTQVVSPKLNSTTKSKKEEVVEENNKQLMESISVSIEAFFENIINSEKLFQYEQITHVDNAEIIVLDDQVDSVQLNPVLEEKPLTIKSQEGVIADNLLNSVEPNEEQLNFENSNCYHIGPFADYDALDAWHKVNKIDADSVSRFNKESKVISGYLVYYPAVEANSKSIDIIQVLKQYGITDSWPISRGKLKGATSIALFVRKNRALSLQEKLVKDGIATEIKEQYKIEQLLYAKILTEDKVFKDTVMISEKQAVSGCKNYTDMELVRE